jgi:hypothetical protein
MTNIVKVSKVTDSGVGNHAARHGIGKEMVKDGSVT